jgi:hypothetical protein
MKHDRVSEYDLGAGIVLTTSTRIEGLPDLPFGIRYNASNQFADLKTGLLCTDLNAHEIQRFVGMGFHSPKYLTIQDPQLQIFTMTCPNINQQSGFQTRCGNLIFSDRYDRSYILTFDFIMLIIAISTCFPKILRVRAFDAACKDIITRNILRHKEYDSFDGLYGYLSVLQEEKPTGEVSSQTNNTTYTPQSGEFQTSHVSQFRECVSEVVCGLSSYTKDYLSTQLTPSQDFLLLLKSCFFQFVAFENSLHTLFGLLFLYSVYRVIKDILMGIHFIALCIVYSLFRINNKSLRYVPQSSNLTLELFTVSSKILQRLGAVSVAFAALIATFCELRAKYKHDKYITQSGMAEELYAPAPAAVLREDDADKFSGTTRDMSDGRLPVPSNAGHPCCPAFQTKTSSLPNSAFGGPMTNTLGPLGQQKTMPRGNVPSTR